MTALCKKPGSNRVAWALGLAILMLGATVNSDASAAVTSTFSGAVDNDFNKAGNWNNGVPGVGDTAIIASNKTANVSSTTTILDLQLNDGSKLSCTGLITLTVTGTITSNGAATITALVNVGPTITVSTGTLDIAFPGAIIVSAGTPTTVTGNILIGDATTGLVTLTINDVLTINGTLTSDGPAANVVSGTGSISVNGAYNENGTLTIRVPTFSTTSGTPTTATPVHGMGVINPDATSTNCTFGGPVTFTNGGITAGVATNVVIFNDNVALTSSNILGNSNSSVSLASGKTLTSNKPLNGTNQIQPIFTNSGTVTVQSGTLDVTGGGTSTGSINGSGGTFNVHSNSGEIFTLNSGASLSGAIEVTSGTFTINTLLTYTGSLLFNGQCNIGGTGPLTVNGAVTVSSGGAGANSTLPSFTVGSLLFNTNDGINLLAPNATLTCTGSMTMNKNCFFVIGSGCTATVGGASTIDQIGSGIAGSGTFALTSTASLISTALAIPNQISCNTTNAGAITVSTGTLDLFTFGATYTQTAGSLSLTSGTTVKVTMQLNGGALKGSGTVNGSVINAGGTVSPGTATTAGSLAITGTYSQAAAGALSIKVGGTAANQFDSVAVTNGATLAGTLNVSLINGFVPVTGNNFDILTYSSKTGSFGTINNAGFTVDSTTSPTKTTLLGVTGATPGGLALTSGPTATPSTAGIGQIVAFTAGTNLSGTTFNWTFGDGTSDNSGNASVTHSFTSAGTFTVTVTATNGAQTSSGMVSVTVKAPSIGTGSDSDGDGFSDAFETAFGSSASDSTSIPVRSGTVPGQFAGAKLTVKLNFAKQGSDSLSLSGSLAIPAGFKADGAKLGLAVGDLTAAFTLDVKGKAKSGNNIASVAIKSSKGIVLAQTSKFSIKLNKANLAPALVSSGLTNADALSKAVTLSTAGVLSTADKSMGLVDTQSFALHYTAKKGKSGSTK